MKKSIKYKDPRKRFFGEHYNGKNVSRCYDIDRIRIKHFKDHNHDYIEYILTHQKHIGHLLLYCLTVDICDDLYNIVKLPISKLEEIVSQLYSKYRYGEMLSDKHIYLKSFVGNIDYYTNASKILYNICVFKYYDINRSYINYYNKTRIKSYHYKLSRNEIRLYKYLREIIVALMDNEICKSEKNINIVDELHKFVGVFSFVNEL